MNKGRIDKIRHLENESDILKIIEPSIVKLTDRFGLKINEVAIVVDPNKQKLHLVRGNQILKTFQISTASKGLGNIMDSEQTPWGTHRIGEKQGLQARVGENVVHNGQIKLGMTTRILTLLGQEASINQGGRVDSAARGIYIHGTPREDQIGRPASHGCIRMKNSEVIELCDLVPNGTLVEILELSNNKT